MNNNSNIQSITLADSLETQYGFLAKRSRIGGRQENQDSAGYSETKHGLLIVVCDGMGGAKGGKTASELAVRNIIEQVNLSRLSDADEILIEAIKVANQAIYHAGKVIPELNGMGTTVTALLIDDNKATAAHVGDSRIYQIRGNRKVFRTFDHSRVFELVKRKSITEEQARLSADSNVILKALGIKSEIDVEINFNLAYEKGDRFMLCSDGISGAVPEKEVIKLIKGFKSVDTTVEYIASTIDKIGNDNGGRHDNLTAVLIELNKNSKLKTKMDKRSKTIIGIVISLLIISLVGNVLQKITKDKIEILNSENIDSTSIKKLNDSIKSLNYKIISKETLLNGKTARFNHSMKMYESKHKSDSIKIFSQDTTIHHLKIKLYNIQHSKAITTNNKQNTSKVVKNPKP